MNRLIYLCVLAFQLQLYGQHKYWIYLVDKSGVAGVPAGYNEFAVQRRILQHIRWNDTDYPLDDTYIREIRLIADSLGYESRWLNAIGAWIHPDSLPRIASLPFVTGIECMEVYESVASQKTYFKRQPVGLKKLADSQVNQLGAPLLQKQNLDGSGIRICIIDAGFSGVEKSPGLVHIHQRKGIAASYDFIRKKEDVFVGSVHGTYVLSCLAGKTEKIQTGLATGATYLLARTESVWSENKAEEDRWIAALEWADRQGAHIINCSMGYASPRYKKTDLNGQSKLSLAMDMAADKGMLVVTAAGNEYNNTWKTLILPADAKKVLTVGALQTFTGQHAWFSSAGPTADGRIKPELTAPGAVVVWGSKKPTLVSGTSFSSPLIAGLAACIWQNGRDTLSGSELKQMLIKSGCWWPSYDHRLGFGIPLTEVLLCRNNHNKVRWEVRTNLSQPTIHFEVPLENDERVYYRIEKKPGEFATYGFVEMAKGNTVAALPLNTYIRSGKTNSNRIKSFSGQNLWINWRGQQKAVKIP